MKKQDNQNQESRLQLSKTSIWNFPIIEPHEVRAIRAGLETERGCTAVPIFCYPETA